MHLIGGRKKIKKRRGRRKNRDIDINIKLIARRKRNISSNS